MASETNQPQGATDEPIEDFSRSHAGILAHLEALDRLPGLIEPAAQARQIAETALRFFDEAVLEHHADEERELFPAVLRSAKPGAEAQRVRQITERLIDEHRRIEKAYRELEPELRRIAKGRDTTLDAGLLHALVMRYGEHARYEEQELLPLSQEILGRDGHHMAALALSLHLRHMKPPVKGYI
ncbi:MAG: hemerythrin domain-containing protein [Burkholderiales bacterium]|nr:MAG: hemerythrin domain-containing protein [Burkholderiales bacterium]